MARRSTRHRFAVSRARRGNRREREQRSVRLFVAATEPERVSLRVNDTTSRRGGPADTDSSRRVPSAHAPLPSFVTAARVVLLPLPRRAILAGDRRRYLSRARRPRTLAGRKCGGVNLIRSRSVAYPIYLAPRTRARTTRVTRVPESQRAQSAERRAIASRRTRDHSDLASSRWRALLERAACRALRALDSSSRDLVFPSTLRRWTKGWTTRGSIQ